MPIKKYESLIQKLRYSKLYRLPVWFFRKLVFNQARPFQEYKVKMRMGHSIYLYPTQPYLKSVLLGKQYHDENVFLLTKFLKPNPVIIDIGANIGLYACAYAQYFKHINPTIVAIEAVDTNFNLLKKNADTNNFKNISSYHIALGDSTGTLEFNLPSESFVGNVAGNNITHPESTKNMIVKKVALDTLDNFSKLHNIIRCDYMKVDIEGAELFLFNGAKEFISKTRPVIQFEYNKFWLEKNSISPKDFFLFFEPLNYVFFIEAKDRFIKIENFSNYIVTEGLIDLLVIPIEKTIS
jgi:FkbM family methyltransferase